MELPKIDLDLLPDFEAAEGVFGSLSDIATATVEDQLVVLMIYLYETMPSGLV